MANDDYSAYMDPEGGSDQSILVTLNKLATKMRVAENDVTEAERILKLAQDRLKDVAERELPELMEQHGMTEFKTSSGLKITIKEVIRASIPKQHTSAGHRWLRDNKLGGIIKRVVALSFGKGDDELATTIAKELMDKGLEVEDKSSVHAQTLASTVRELLKDGVDVPMDILGVHRTRSAVLSV